jgi:hypothetical protein
MTAVRAVAVRSAYRIATGAAVRSAYRTATAMTVAVIAAGALACRAHASAAECRTLLDRYVELLVREQDAKASDSELERQKQATRVKASHDASFQRCPEEVTAEELRCAMQAPNVDEFEKCLE